MQTVQDLEATVQEAMKAAADRLWDSPNSFKAYLDYQRGFFDGVCFVNKWSPNHNFYVKLCNGITPGDWVDFLG